MHELPQGGRATKGKAIVNLVQLDADDSVATVLAVREFSEGRYVIMATQKGTVKKTALMDFSRPRANGIIAINIADDDRLVAARLTDGEMEVFLATRQGPGHPLLRGKSALHGPHRRRSQGHRDRGRRPGGGHGGHSRHPQPVDRHP